MATQRSTFVIPVTEFAAALLARAEVSPRAQVTANQVAQLLPGTAVVVYTIEDLDNPAWARKAVAGEITVGETMEFGTGTLGTVAEKKTVLVFEGSGLQREDYGHLDTRRTVNSLAYVPLLVDHVLFGAIELVSYDQTFPEEMLEALHEIAELASPAIAAAQSYESERNASLNSISRVTQMYDLEKVFNSTLEMDELLGIIAKKFQDVMGVQGVNLWMVNNNSALELVRSAGYDPTVKLGEVQQPGEGIAGDISDNGEPVLIHDPANERLQKRNARTEDDGGVFSLVAAALMEHQNLVGVVEAVNRIDGEPFDEDDQFLLINICETASNALHNASLLMAERKVEILEMLVTISREITSTLNLERVLQTIVNAPQAVIPYERAAVALEQGGRYKLSAVTGFSQIDAGAPEVSALNDVLRWAMFSEEVVHIRQHGTEIDAAREETRAKFKNYFETTGMRAFYAIPLTDDTGRVGILGLESADPDFLSTAHLEILQVLAGQATVALRNAQMYKEVPFISVLEPVLEKKRKFMAMGRRRRTLWISAAVAVLIFLAGFPLPLRVDGDAVAAPVHSAQIEPEVEGVVSRVYVREGDHVTRDQVIAELANWEPRSVLAQAQAKYQTALLQMNRSLAANDGGEAGVQRIQADFWKSEVARDEELLDKTRLRSPIDGLVATPHVEDMVGRRLQYGDSFAEVVDTSRAIVDVAVNDADSGLLRAGARASIKLNSFPMRIFRGDVTVVSPRGILQGDSRVFFARVAVSNSDGAIRAGMEGRGKVRVGWYPAGYVLFRKPLLWIYSRAWSWLGV
ncbi:MAG: GAF domain-containing protein [Candidatus Sulfotelmatobacter sp.]